MTILKGDQGNAIVMDPPSVFPDSVAQQDAKRILEYVAQNRAVFRLELAHDLNLCLSDATNILRELVEAGLVRHDELDPETHGGIYTPTKAGIQLVERNH